MVLVQVSEPILRCIKATTVAKDVPGIGVSEEVRTDRSLENDPASRSFDDLASPLLGDVAVFAGREQIVTKLEHRSWA